jgi:membrane protease YdiL (CAAX protease family)
MLGIIVQLLISWIIIWFFERGNLGVLGFYPTKKRLLGFAVFFIVTALCSSSDFFMRMAFAKQEWELNPKLTAELILTGVWWNVKSVLFEELIFRGVLFYMLIKKLGAVKAIIISSIAFGIYHWYSHEVIGKPVEMAITFITTGLMGVIYAYGYAKTFSLYIPIAIHLGWNLVRSVVFSETVIGEQLFVQVKPVPEVTVSYFTYFSIIYLPLLSCLLINFFMLKKMKQVEMSNVKVNL